jgi:AraC-like DNA-binding protein
MQPQHSVLAAYARFLIALVARWNVPAEPLLASAGLSLADVEAPAGRIPLSAMLALIDEARARTREPALGVHLGAESRILTYGFLGFGLLSAPSLRDAIHLLIEFQQVLGTALSFRLVTEGGVACLVVQENVYLGSARDFVLTGVLTALQRFGAVLTGTAPSSAVDVAIDEPAYFARVAHLAPPMRFGQPLSQIVFDPAKLDLPIMLGDRASMELAREQCARSLEELGRTQDVVERLGRLLARREDRCSFADAAAALALSQRTLKRKLVERGVRYSDLLDRSLRERAVSLLRARSLSIEEVAARLGYSTSSNFLRAFRRWTGKSPAAYRREISASGGLT